MRVDLKPSRGYEPFPSVVSETNAKYRWPIPHPRKPLPPPRGEISVDGPLQSPPPKPRLKYHRQSSHTDAYVKFPTDCNIADKPKSDWTTPVGKHGHLMGQSMYEKDFEWPVKYVQAERFPPMISTVGLGILPILGSAEEKPSVEYKETLRHVEKKINTLSSESLMEPSWWVLNCNPHKPVKCILDPRTTHRADYIVHSKVIDIQEVPQAEESHFQFTGSGKMETATTSMRDYSLRDTLVNKERSDPINKCILSRRNTFDAEDKCATCSCHKDDIKSNYVEEEC